MLVVFTYPDKPAQGMFPPFEATCTTLALDWAKESVYAEGCASISILDSASYLQDEKAWGKRSPIDLYLLLIRSKATSRVTEVAGPMHWDEVIEAMKTAEAGMRAVPLFKMRHAFDVYKPHVQDNSKEVVADILRQLSY